MVTRVTGGAGPWAPRSTASHADKATAATLRPKTDRACIDAPCLNRTIDPPSPKPNPSQESRPRPGAAAVEGSAAPIARTSDGRWAPRRRSAGPGLKPGLGEERLWGSAEGGGMRNRALGDGSGDRDHQ